MRGYALGVAVGSVVFCITILMHAEVLTTQDLYLHISVGRWILAHQGIPHSGIFSASMANAPWVAHEWLSAVVYALLYDILGWGGVVAGVALTVAIAIGLLAAVTARTLGPLGAVCSAALAFGLCAHHLIARPHVATMLLAVVWIAAHVRARERDRVPPLYLLPLMTLWANLHGAFMLGIGFSALFAGEAVFECETVARAREAAIRWCLFLAACVAAAAINPNGIEGLLFPLKMLIVLRPALDSVYEWAPSSMENNLPLILWCFLLLFLALLAGIRLPITRLVMLMILLYMAFAHRRHTELLGLAAPLLLQHAIAERLSSIGRPVATGSGGAIGKGIAVAALAAASILALVQIPRIDHGQDRFSPIAAVDAMLARGIPGQVLNEQYYGGYLIFRGLPPLIDGRIELYGNDFVLRYMALDRLPGLLAQYWIAWTILTVDDPRVALMDNLPGWTRIYSDEIAAIHIRQSAQSK